MDEMTFTDPGYWWEHRAEAFEALLEGSSHHLAHVDESERLVWSVEQAAELLGVSQSALYDAIKRGEVPSVRIGRRVLVPKKALEEWIERGT